MKLLVIIYVLVAFSSAANAIFSLGGLLDILKSTSNLIFHRSTGSPVNLTMLKLKSDALEQPIPSTSSDSKKQPKLKTNPESSSDNEISSSKSKILKKRQARRHVR